MLIGFIMTQTITSVNGFGIGIFSWLKKKMGIKLITMLSGGEFKPK